MSLFLDAFVPPVESRLLLESTTEANSSLERKSEICIKSKNSSRFRGSRRRRAQVSYIPESSAVISALVCARTEADGLINSPG